MGQEEYGEKMFADGNWAATTKQAWKEGILVASTNTRYDLLPEADKRQHLRMMLIQSRREMKHKNRKTKRLAASSAASTIDKSEKLVQLVAEDIPQRPILVLPELPPEDVSESTSKRAAGGLSSFLPPNKRSRHQMDSNDDDDEEEEEGVRPAKRARANLQLGLQLPLRPASP